MPGAPESWVNSLQFGSFVRFEILGIKVKLRKGLDLPIIGQPEQVIESGHVAKQVALLGADFVGLKPKMLVEVGQAVGLGEPLFLDKHDPDLRFVSPGTGRVVAINRGRRRAFHSIVVRLDAGAAAEAVFDPVNLRGRSAIRGLLLQTGLWTGFRTRPYNHVANSSSTPHAVFVTAVDTRPLAADPSVIIGQRESEFKRGLEVIRQLGPWPVYLCTGPNWTGPEVDDDGILRAEFDGPHPAGLVGTHIHHLHPVAADRAVWHIGYQDVIAIGHLFNTGRLLTERVVSIAGPGALKPRLLRTRPGANVVELVSREMPPEHPWRVISGSVLDGHEAIGPFGYLGHYHNQVSIIPDAVERRLFGWIVPTAGHYGTAGLFAAVRRRNRLHEFTTARHGRQTAMIPAGVFERVMPLDILPVPLLKALLVRDTDSAQALGCLELVEEDLALCSFVCPAKLDYGAALRINLDQIEKEG